MAQNFSLPRLLRAEALLLVVDVQERLLPAMREPARVERGCVLLCRAFGMLGLPVLVTEQNPTRLGPTIPAIVEAAGGCAAVSKMRFSGWVPPVREAIVATGKRQIILCGIEAHVCVLQTALDLLSEGYEVFMARDAISSRHEWDERAAFERMARAGVVAASAEMITFELLQEAGTPEFKALLPHVK